MPLPPISQNKGFLILEALIAMAFLVMVIPAALSLGFSAQSLQTSAEHELDSLAGSEDLISNGAFEQAASSSARYFHEFGKSTCTFAEPALSTPKIYPNNPTNGGITFRSTVAITDSVARNGFMYVTTDSDIQIDADFYIIDVRNPAKPVLVASLNTGQGLAGVAIAGHYAYLANPSSVSQLQIVDIQDRTKPVLVASLKLPLPTATTTAPHAASVSYDNGAILLGTEKWTGDELNDISVSSPAFPQYVGGFDTDTLVNAAYADAGGVFPASKYAYVADADADSMRVLDISNPSQIALLSGFSPAGSDVLEGKTFAVSANNILYFARDGGGFDNPSQYELFSFDLSADPLAASPTHVLNVPGGIYGIVASGGYVFLAEGDNFLEVWKDDLSVRVAVWPLSGKPVSLMCDHDRLYVGINGSNDFIIMATSS